MRNTPETAPLKRGELAYAGTGLCDIVKRGVFMLVKGGGTRWCVDLGQARGTMASRPLLALYAACHASKQMCSSARWALRCARPQADIHAIHSRIVPRCGFVPMAR